MSALGEAAEDYLQMRRALGYKLEVQGWLLRRFVSHLEEIGGETVTIERALAWATQPAAGSPAYWAQRLSVVRGFARHLQTIDATCEVPPARLLPYRPARATPYLYTPGEIAALMRATSTLPLALQKATYQTLIGLLAVSGLRIGETIRLDRDDIDAGHQLLRIIDSKFAKSREVALDVSAMHALNAYRRLRDRLCPQPRCEAFFVSTAGTRLLAPSIHDAFNRLVRTADLKPRSARCRPRVHDLRHSFAVRTLLDWHRDGVDVQARLPLLSTHMGHVNPASTFYYLHAAPELLALASRAARADTERTLVTPLAPTLEAFFTDRLLRQRRVSPNTIASYRDTFRLLLGFLKQQTGTPPARLKLTDLDAPTIGAFLEHLETERGNSARTRNIRLAAVHSFFQYCALRHPEHAALIQRVLAIPAKRSEKRIVTFLNPEEVKALLASPDRSTRAGRRDHALLLAAAQTGLRVSELLALTCADVQLSTGPHLRTIGKGRKERIAPLTSQTVAVLKVWTRERQGQPADPLFPTRTGTQLTRDAVERRLAKHIATAQRKCPTLRSKQVSMHALRHTAAMMLLTAGVDTSTIALWLGHEQERTTHIYLHADLALKQRALDRTTAPDGRPGRYRPPDTLLAFLDNL